MAQKTRAELLALWKAGYRPNQQDYANLFESIFMLLEYGEKPGLMHLRNAYDASSNQFPSSGGSGESGAILAGNFFPISVGGTLGGQPVVDGQTIVALIDNPGQTAGNWAISAVSASSYPSITDDSITVTINAILKANKQAVGGYYVNSFSSTPNFNLNNGNSQKMILTGNLTSLTLSNKLNGGSYLIYLVQDATGSRTIPTPDSTFGSETDNSADFKTDPNSVNMININVDADGITFYTIETYTP